MSAQQEDTLPRLGHKNGRSLFLWPIIVTLLGLLGFILPAAGATQQKSLELLFERIDTDGNGLISETEWHAAMQKRLEHLDSNKDGNLSRQEMEQARTAMKERFLDRRSMNRGL